MSISIILCLTIIIIIQFTTQNTTAISITYLQANNPLGYAYTIYHNSIFFFFHFSLLGKKMNQLQESATNSKKKKKQEQDIVEEKNQQLSIITEDNAIDKGLWDFQDEKHLKKSQHSMYKSAFKEGNQYRRDDGKDQALLAWLASNKVRKKSINAEPVGVKARDAA